MTLALDLNFGAIVTAAFASLAAGAVWYSKWVFAPAWQLLVRKTEEEVAAYRKRALALSALTSLLAALIMAVFADRLGAVGPLEGARLGFLAWAGFSMPPALADYAFTDRPMRLFAINQGHDLLRFALMGVIIGAWR